jgi:probable rRNA maturation factor
MSNGEPPDTPETAVLVDNRQDTSVDVEAVTDLALRCLRGEGATGELSISFVTLDEMGDLHERYVREEGPTDVLSFPQGEDGLLGDVVICPAFAAKNNPELDAEVRLLVVHGILHLLGHDHEDDDQRAVMWAKQEAYTGVRVP